MSVHRSLVIKSSLQRHRNVLTRAERIEHLAKLGKWKEGDSIFRLPKVKGEVKIKKAKGGKGKKEKKGEQVTQEKKGEQAKQEKKE